MKLQPKTIVECGPGTSTLLFSFYAKNYGEGGATVVSIENSAQWLKSTDALLRAYSLREAVRFVYAPLQEFSITRVSQEEGSLFGSNAPAGNPLVWYTVDSVLTAVQRAGSKVDFLFVDGRVAAPVGLLCQLSGRP